MTKPVVESPRLAALAQEYAERAEPLPEGRSGITTARDLEAIRYRIIHGVARDANGE